MGCGYLGQTHHQRELGYAPGGCAHRSADADDAVAIAWTGTDHRLNIIYDAYNASPKKLTLDETSDSPPALEIRDYLLYIAWRGRDTAHTLNVLPIDDQRHAQRRAEGEVERLQQPHRSAAVRWDTANNQFLLSCTAVDPANRILLRHLARWRDVDYPGEHAVPSRRASSRPT